MAWSEPKTDWVESDYFNYSDYSRIRDNFIMLKEIADALWYSFPNITPMDIKNSYTDIMYASDMNKFEDNLDVINDNSYAFEIGNKTIYEANGNTPLFTEYNRIENAMLLLYNTMQIQYKMIPKLAIRLGGNNKIKL